MKRNRILGLPLLLLLSGIMLITACVKDDFDRPPINPVPEGDVYTIAQLRQIYADSGEYTFEKDASTYGVVTIDETTGNIYKNIYVQDVTAGINLHLLESGGTRIGDSIRVFLKGCTLSDYNGLIQVDNVHNDSSIIILENGMYRNPELVTLPMIYTGAYEAKLVKLENVQFVQADLGKPWSDPDQSTNRYLEDCDGNTMIVRTSSYASFATEELPGGKGEFIAVVGRYNDDWQLYIRTPDELSLTGERCGGGGGGGEPLDELFEDFQSLNNYDEINLEGWTNVMETGDRNWIAKEFEGNVYAQATAYNSGLDAMVTWLVTPAVKVEANTVLSFKNAQAFWSHGSDEPMEVFASTDFDGDVTTATWTKLNPTLADEGNPNYEFIESGDVDLSSFGDAVYVAFKYTGSNDKSTNFQIDDVSIGPDGGGGGGGTGTTYLFEDFESLNDYDEIDLDGWLNVALKGTRLWIAKEYDNNVYAQSTAYNGGEENEMWLITPAINLDEMTAPKLRFRNSVAYYTHNGMTVLISTDFDGTNIESATWTELDPTLADGGTANYAWIQSGDVDLSLYSGTGYIAFKYVGDDTGAGDTESRIIDDVEVYE